MANHFGNKGRRPPQAPQAPANFGEFEIVEDPSVDKAGVTEEVVEGQFAPARVRMPGKGELIGVVIQRFGGARMEVRTTDGKSRNCRVPGRYRKQLWLRPKDVVMVTPWPDDDSKADIIYKYNSSAVNQLRKKGLLSGLEDGF